MNENKLTPEEIQTVLEEHRLWLDSKRTKGQRADFSRKNLQQANFEGVNLTQANLEGANLAKANLMRANFERANFKGAILDGANLQRANLIEAVCSGAVFTRADLTESRFMEADLRGAILTEANLTRAHLENANLEGSLLAGAYFKYADFEGANLAKAHFGNANLEGANLTRANLEGTNLKGVVGFDNMVNTLSLTKNIQHYEHTINQLEKELQQAEAALKNNEADQEQVQKSQAEIDKLNEEIESAQSSKEQAEKALAELQEELDNLKKELRDRINDAKKSLASALTNTDTQIKSNNKYAKWFGWGGMAVFSIAFCALTGIPIYIWCNNLFPENNWHLLFYTFPVIAMILIATTLLRHQKSLLNEVRHFSNMKHQIELYSGLLEASQHAAASFGDPKKADEYVQQTFTQIRDRLLQVQLPHDQPLVPASEEPADANHLIGLLSKIADLGSKKLG